MGNSSYRFVVCKPLESEFKLITTNLVFFSPNITEPMLASERYKAAITGIFFTNIVASYSPLGACLLLHHLWHLVSRFSGVKINGIHTT